MATVIKNRKAYDEIKDIIDADSFGTEAEFVYREIKEYYEKDKKANEVSKEIITEVLRQKLPEKHFGLFKDLIHSLYEVTTSEANLISLLIQNKLVRVKEELANALLQGKNYKDILTKLKQLEQAEESNNETEVFNGTEYLDIIDQYTNGDCIKIWPESLNNKIGGLIPETNVLVYGRPEIGKSMLSITNAGYFALNGIRTLYFGNEDPHRNMRMRLMSCVLGLSREQILSKTKQEIDKLVKSSALSNIYFQPGHPGSIREIEATCKRIKCKAVIIDQLKNLRAVQSDNRVLELESLGQEARSLAKRLGLVCINVVQAGDSGDNKRVLGLGDVDFSNTGLPGAVDLMLGFGANEQDLIHNDRYISIAKNKLSGNHDTIKVKVDTKLSRVFDL